jgi:glucosamine--fructose-6-phosphate aminotransferase (isomerizing)
MCGIFGILTTLKNHDVKKIIIDGLIQLQNRGYDSSGICTLSNKEFEIHKYASTNEATSIQKLLNTTFAQNASRLGIGHNRWATHGAKNDTNAHPHISNDKRFVLVHNGIIENYLQLKIELMNNGYTFYSQTDTEVIVNLISYHFNQCNNTFEAVKKTIERLEGTYGIIVMNSEEEDKLYAVRNGSPLLIGYNNDYAIITSEQSGFCNMVNTYITLNNDDICVINISDKINVQTTNYYNEKKITILNYDLTPDPYPHWTIKEINEQPTTILNSFNCGGRIKNESEVKLGGLEEKIHILKDINNIIILGCGTSYHAGLYASYYFKQICNFNTVQVFDGADFSHHDIPKIGNSACILISQSGETKDLHHCIEITKEYNIFTIGVINVVDSLIAREVDCGIYCNAGREMGVASTKAFTSQVICLSLMSIWFAQIHDLNKNKRIKMIKDLQNLSNDFKNTLINVENEVIRIAEILKDYDNLFILGSGCDQYIAKEGSLKIKEISYIHSEAYSSNALKHGPFALLDKKFPVILLNCVEEQNAKVYNCFEEVHSRDSPVFIITNNKDISLNRDCEILHVAYNKSYASLLGILALQLLSYYMSVKRGAHPDLPRHLAKTISV